MVDQATLYTFLDSITLPVQFLGFEDEFIPFPAPFSVLGMVNSVTSKSRKTGRTLNFKDFLKRPYMVTRMHAENGDSGEPSRKRAREDPDQTNRYSQRSIGKDLLNLQSDEVTEALNNLNNFLGEDNIQSLFNVLKNSRDQCDLEIGLGIHMIAKLTGNAFTRRDKAQLNCICGCSKKLRASDEMYIGSQSTWYGELDILAGKPASGRAAVTVCESVEEDTDETEDGDDIASSSDGRGFNQAVAQSIVFAFTEFNRDTDKGCVIPTVLIDKTMYYIMMYNPVTDVLVSVSNSYNFGPKPGENGEFIRAIMLLWVTLNHRIFFAKWPKLREEQQSEFGNKINDLQKYRELKNFSQKITKRNNDDFKYPIGVSYLDISHPTETFPVFARIERNVLKAKKTESDNT